MQISSNLVIADPVHGGTVLQEQIDDRTLLPPWAYCAFASGGDARYAAACDSSHGFRQDLYADGRLRRAGEQ